MNKLRAFVVDDDPVVRSLLASYLEGCECLELVGMSATAEAAVGEVMATLPDLLFLDVSLPDMDGYRLLSTMHRRPKVIMLSGDATRAAEAFDAGAIDFLLKPIARERFLRAVARAVGQRRDLPGATLSIPADRCQEIDLKCGRSLERVSFEDIRYIQAMGNYVKVFLNDGHVIANATMKEMEAAVPADRFLRVHRSYLVALDAMESIGVGSIGLNSGHIPVGVRYRRRVKARLDAMRSAA
jgi:DNA-binding LytR/AlgR family response regulator